MISQRLKLFGARALGVLGAVGTGFAAMNVHAQVATGTIITAVGAGIDTGTSTWGDMVSQNLGKILILAGITLGIGFLLGLFKRVGRR